jgi:hypothetical protein
MVGVYKEDVVSTAQPLQDPQDKAFGAAASRDQEVVDKLEMQGVTEDQLPDEPARHPRAGGKARPEGETNVTSGALGGTN